MKIYKILSLFLCGIIFAGCVSSEARSLYRWDGVYTKSLQDYLSEEADIYANLQMLKQSVDHAELSGIKPPPGVLAHLGLLYSNSGDIASARAYFDKEAQNFPEAKSYMEFLKNQMKKGGKNAK